MGWTKAAHQVGKRKIFVRSDITTHRVEHSRLPSGEIVIPAEEIPPSNTIVTFPRGVDRFNSFDFGRWYGSGFDQIVYTCQRQIERFLDRQDAEVRISTVLTYCTNGLKNFFNFLTIFSTVRQRGLTLEHINRELIDGYLVFLRDSGIESSAQKSNYSATKAVLKALCRRGFILEVHVGDNVTFPSNPFPGVHRKTKGEQSLSLRERKAFTIAIRTAVQPIFLDNAIPTSELLAYALLVVALHTGRNTSPLLEMTPDCLRSHPKEDMLFLVLYKHRGHSTSKAVLRTSCDLDLGIESMPTVRPTVAALIKRVIELSAQLRSDAHDDLIDRIWLYRKRATTLGHGFIGDVRAVTDDTLYRSIQILVKNYNLVDADGRPLRINVSRLRKTFVNRVYEILDGDVVATAVAAGNTVGVTMASYLQPGEEAQKNWKFLGIALVQELLTTTIGATERTPVGRCTDIRNGEYAPKRNGSACMSFFNCIRCRNYVVTGDDLYKVFSFYWRILGARAHIAPQRWRRQFSHIARLIERDVVESGVKRGVFKQAQVDRERERARQDPHPFWRPETIIAQLAGDIR